MHPLFNCFVFVSGQGRQGSPPHHRRYVGCTSDLRVISTVIGRDAEQPVPDQSEYEHDKYGYDLSSLWIASAIVVIIAFVS